MDKQALRVKLYDLAERVAAGIQEDVGICHAIAFCPSSVERGARKAWLVRHFKAWPEYSGDPSYPVPGLPGVDIREFVKSHFPVDPVHAFIFLKLWKGEYGEARKRLLTFLIGQINVELASEV